MSEFLSTTQLYVSILSVLYVLGSTLYNFSNLFNFFFIKWDHYFNINKYRAMLVNIFQKLLDTQIKYMIDVLLQTNKIFFFLG